MYRFAVIGDPIEHSLSPRMHSYFMENAGIPGEYGRIRVRNKEELQEVVTQLQSGELDGINITAPWKSAIREYLNSCSAEAEQIGAVNTVRANGDTLTGHNTDMEGFLRSLQEFLAGKSVKSACIIGAGGAARAVLLALLRIRPQKISVINRTVRNGVAMIDELAPNKPISLYPLEFQVLTACLNRNDLVVNTLPFHGRKIFEHHSVFDAVESSGYYYDLLYSRGHLREVQSFRRYGWNSTDGLDMLIYQGISSLEYWTETPVADTIQLTELRKMLRDE